MESIELEFRVLGKISGRDRRGMSTSGSPGVCHTVKCPHKAVNCCNKEFNDFTLFDLQSPLRRVQCLMPFLNTA